MEQRSWYLCRPNSGKRVIEHYIINFIDLLAWEPSAVKVIKSYSRRLPALERFHRETNFSPFLTLKISKPSYEYSRGSPEFPQSKFEVNRSGGFLSFDRTNRQTEITT